MVDTRGHFAAWEELGIFTTEVRAAFREQSLVETALFSAKQLLERRRRTAHSKVLVDAELVR